MLSRAETDGSVVIWKSRRAGYADRWAAHTEMEERKRKERTPSKPLELTR